MDICDIIKDWLITHGYDGLYYDDPGDYCCCFVDDKRGFPGCDLSGGYEDCSPGYKVRDSHISPTQEPTP